MSPGPVTWRARARARRSRAFAAGFAIVVGVLAAVGLGGAALTTAQGPRVTDMQFDPEAAVAASGSRLILTTTQSLTDIAPEQVTVTPATDFTVDTSGRSVGVRFALPLWDETDYTVRIEGVVGLGGGAATTIEEKFTTPPLEVYLLQRAEAEDTVFRTDLAGDAAVPVFRADHIEDFRATSGHLVMATLDDEGHSQLVVTDLDGSGERRLPLPGEGVVTDLQSADRGNLVGYTFTDADIGADSGRESMLFTASLSASRADEEPAAVERAGGDSRVADWRFVPGTDTILMLTFDGALTLVSTADAAADPVALGNAVSIDGIARGSSVVIVERADGPVAIDLATAQEQEVAATDPALGQASSILALPPGPGSGEAGTLRVLSRFDDDGITPLDTSVAVVDASGAEVRSVFAVGADDSLLHVCVSPSGRYAAMLVAPDAVDNPYDGYTLPLPQRLQTHVVSLADGAEAVALRGFGISWCQGAPSV
jgi:hypothetical protein